MYILSVDFGTSSVKLAVIDEKLNILASAKAAYGIRVYHRDWAEMDADEIFGAMAQGMKALSEYAPDIGLIAFDTFAPSVVFMDKEGEPLYPLITHLDRRSRKQTNDILQAVGKDCFQSITGIQPFAGGASITTVMWMMENAPEIFKKVYKVGHLDTYIYQKLTGVWLTDPVNASITGMYHTTRWSGWSAQLCGTFKIPMQILPDIHLPGSLAGRLCASAARLCGLKEGIPVAVGTHDTTVSHLAAGNAKEGDILNISGSNEMISILTDKPVTDDRYYLRNAVTPGQWQIFAITSGGLALDWFRKEFYRDMDEKTFFAAEMTDAIQNNAKKTGVKFLPYLSGDRQSLQPKTGGFSGVTLEATRKDFLAAILLGIHEPVLDTIRICEKFMTLNKNIKITGGMNSADLIGLKKMLLPGYRFEAIPDAHIISNAILGMKQLTGN